MLTSSGRHLLFLSRATDLAADLPSAGYFDVYLFDATNGQVRLVSVNAAGTAGGGGASTFAVVSPDGRYVAFSSEADDLVPNDTNGVSDVFLRDMESGTTTLVSVRSGPGGAGNGASVEPALTPDGRWVAFVSEASDLTSDDTNGIADVFVRDVQQGATVCASPGASPVPPYRTRVGAPRISEDGRYVAFESSATGLVANVAGQQAIYVRDLQAGVTESAIADLATPFTALLGSALDPTRTFAHSPVLSGDGRWLAFKAEITQEPLQTNWTGVARLDRSDGRIHAVAIRALRNRTGFAQASGPVMSQDGRYLAFAVQDTPIAPPQIVRWDATTDTTQLVSVAVDGATPASGICDAPAITADGRYVAFVSCATNLVPESSTGGFQAYLRDMTTSQTTLLSLGEHGPAGGGLETGRISLSSQAEQIAFEAPADNLVANDRNRRTDVFRRDLPAESTALISRREVTVLSASGAGSSAPVGPCLSGDGHRVVFVSQADDLSPLDTNGMPDVYVRDLLLNTNLLISVNREGTASGNALSDEPAITPDGRYVLFSSYASDLVADDTPNTKDLFVRDLTAGTTTLASVRLPEVLSRTPSMFPCGLSDDGHFALFESNATNLVPSGSGGLYRRDLINQVTELLPTTLLSYEIYGYSRLSPDGQYAAYSRSGNLRVLGCVRPLAPNLTYAGSPVDFVFSGDSRFLFGRFESLQQGATNVLVRIDPVSGTNRSVSLPLPATYQNSLLTLRGLSASRDGRWLAFSSHKIANAAALNTLPNVFVFDFDTDALLLVSAGLDGPANGPSSLPGLSADGRFVVYSSAASNLVPNDTNGVSDVFLFDRLTGQNRLLSQNAQDGVIGNGPSTHGSITPDGTTVVFRSDASDLVPNDLNRLPDVLLCTLEHPVIADVDQDGMDDAWERRWFGDLAHDGLGDTDADGMSDRAEFRSGTGPTDSSSVFRGEILASGAGPGTVRWPAVPGRAYRVEYLDQVNGAVWQRWKGVVMIAGNQAWFDDAASAANERYYRITVLD